MPKDTLTDDFLETVPSRLRLNVLPRGCCGSRTTVMIADASDVDDAVDRPGRFIWIVRGSIGTCGETSVVEDRGVDENWDFVIMSDTSIKFTKILCVL